MSAFFEMLRRVHSSAHYDRMLQTVKPLKDHLGVNFFWYYHLNKEGYYTYAGTHASWSEFSFEHQLTSQFPCLRHPSVVKPGIQLMKDSSSSSYKETLGRAWETFQINFNVNLIFPTAEGIEAFGFATNSDHPKMDELLLNEIPLLKRFIKHFKVKNQKLFHLLYENQVNFGAYLGPKFYEGEQIALKSREQLLRKLGLFPRVPLTRREKEVLPFLSSGFPSSYIAKHLQISYRTVENYIENIKGKLDCDNKSELIQKAKDLVEINQF